MPEAFRLWSNKDIAKTLLSPWPLISYDFIWGYSRIKTEKQRHTSDSLLISHIQMTHLRVPWEAVVNTKLSRFPRHPTLQELHTIIFWGLAPLHQLLEFYRQRIQRSYVGIFFTPVFENRVRPFQQKRHSKTNTAAPWGDNIYTPFDMLTACCFNFSAAFFSLWHWLVKAFPITSQYRRSQQ